MTDTIDDLIKAMSFPPGWDLKSIRFTKAGIYSEYYPPSEHIAWKHGAVVGIGKSVEESLRDSQKRCWDMETQYGKGAL